jgi:hypothetical protein
MGTDIPNNVMDITAGPGGQTLRPPPCSPLAEQRVPHVAMDSLEASVPLAVEGCHGAEASSLGRLAVGPAAPPSAGRCGRRRRPRGPIGRQGYRSGSPPQGDPQGRAAVQGGRLQQRRRECIQRPVVMHVQCELQLVEGVERGSVVMPIPEDNGTSQQSTGLLVGDWKAASTIC